MPELPDLKIGNVVPADPSDLQWDEVARKLERDALPQTRAIAEKWAGSISGLLGIFGLAGFVKGREDIAGLAANARVSTGVLLAVSVTAAIAAVFLAALAAQGAVRTMSLPTGRKLRTWTLRRVERAGRQLAASRFLALLALLCLAGAVGVIWFGPRGSESRSDISATTRDGRTICGALVGSEGGKLAIKGKAGIHILALPEIISLAEKSC